MCCPWPPLDGPAAVLAEGHIDFKHPGQALRPGQHAPSRSPERPSAEPNTSRPITSNRPVQHPKWTALQFTIALGAVDACAPGDIAWVNTAPSV